MQRRTGYIVGLLLVALFGVIAYIFPLRWDLTADKRYSLGEATQSLLSGLDEPIEVEVLLSGDLNSGFRRLRRATM